MEIIKNRGKIAPLAWNQMSEQICNQIWENRGFTQFLKSSIFFFSENLYPDESPVTDKATEVTRIFLGNCDPNSTKVWCDGVVQCSLSLFRHFRPKIMHARKPI